MVNVMTLDFLLVFMSSSNEKLRLRPEAGHASQLLLPKSGLQLITNSLSPFPLLLSSSSFFIFLCLVIQSSMCGTPYFMVQNPLMSALNPKHPFFFHRRLPGLQSFTRLPSFPLFKTCGLPLPFFLRKRYGLLPRFNTWASRSFLFAPLPPLF